MEKGEQVKTLPCLKSLHYSTHLRAWRGDRQGWEEEMWQLPSTASHFRETHPGQDLSKCSPCETVQHHLGTQL